MTDKAAKEKNGKNVYKEVLLEFIDYIRYKIENDTMTISETEALLRSFTANLDLTGTAGGGYTLFNASNFAVGFGDVLMVIDSTGIHRSNDGGSTFGICKQVNI